MSTNSTFSEKSLEEPLSERRRTADLISLMSAVLEHSPVPVVVFDRDQRIVGASMSWVRTLRDNARDPIGKSIRDLYQHRAPSLVAKSEGAQEEVFATGKPHSRVDALPTSHGERQVQVNLFPVLDEAGQVIYLIGFYPDVTEMVQTQRNLRDRNEVLEQFASAASHDLKEPARVAAMYTDLVLERYRSQLDEQGVQFLAMAHRSAARLGLMLDDLRSFSRFDVGSVGNADVAAAAHAAWENLAPIVAEKRASLSETTQGARVSVAPGTLIRLLQNLFGNSLKFCDREPAAVSITAEREGAFWKVTVADNGIGLDPEKAEQAFRAFGRLHAKRTYEGTGLGLSLCRRIVMSRGGEIGIGESGELGGATIWFTLPATDSAD